MCHNVNRKKQPKFFQNTSIERFEIISSRVRKGYTDHIGERANCHRWLATLSTIVVFVQYLIILSSAWFMPEQQKVVIY